MKIKVVIIDDEVNGIELLRNLLSGFPNIEVVSTAQSVAAGKAEVEKHQPSLVFLDIQMPDADGFDFLNKNIRLDFEVVVVSAFDYALKAFKHNVLHYILKPIDVEDLAEAIRKTELKLHQRNRGNEPRENISAATGFNNPFNKISVPGKEGLVFISITEIIRCEGLLNYTRLVLTSGEVITSSKTLLEFEKLLSHANFFRIHKSHLINLSYLKEYVRGDNGYVVMSDGSTLQVSRRTREPFMKRLSPFSATWSSTGN